MPVRAELRKARTELRTALTGADPGLGRLRLAATACASMMLAVALTAVLRAVVADLQITILVFAAVLAMTSNLSVSEPDPAAQRVTIALMALPAGAAITAGTLLSPYRVVAAAVFVLVMVAAVYVRRFGPRGFALGMGAFFPYFFTQFLGARPAELPWLLVAGGIGIGSTLLLRGWVFAERPQRTLDRLVRSFRARLHALTEAAADVLSAEPDEIEGALAAARRSRVRLNDTALLVADQIELLEPDHGSGDLPLQVLDTELAAERLAVSIRRLVTGDEPVDPLSRRTLVAGIRGLGRATATTTPPERVPALLDGARRSVARVVAGTGAHGDRLQRVGFAVTRLAEALASARQVAVLEFGPQPAPGAATRESGDPGPAAAEDAQEAAPGAGDPGDEDEKDELRLTTRQAVQVGVATSLAIVAGELISPSRWYWAVIAAFVVFAGTSSRGDVLDRGAQRVVGTIGGVAAGMGLAALVGDHRLLALVLLFVCAFFALYLARVSQALMAFWITAVLALLYGLIGQFSTETLLLRIAETAAGAALGMLAGYLILPKRTREAFEEALDDTVDAADATLAAAVDRITGHEPPAPPVELARDLDDALATLRARVRPLGNPLVRRRGRSSYERALRVLTAVDHYARALARVSDTLTAPQWEPTLVPAAARVRANLDGLRTVLHDADGGHDDAPPRIGSAEQQADAAEAAAARTGDHCLRAELLGAIRLLRRIDQAVVGFAADLGAADDPADDRAGRAAQAPHSG